MATTKMLNVTESAATKLTEILKEQAADTIDVKRAELRVLERSIDMSLERPSII